MAESLFAIAAKHKPETIALSSSDVTYSYSQYLAAIISCSDYMHSNNIKSGDHIAIIAKNSIEYAVALMAAFYSGIVVMPISPRFPDKSILDIIDKTKAKAAIADGENCSRNAYPKSTQVMKLEEAVTFSQTVSNVKPNVSTENKPAVFVMTSGSTGTPKLAKLSLANLFNNAQGSNQVIPLQPGDRWLLSLPLYHVGGIGILMRAFFAGATVVIPPNNKPIELLIEDERITHLSVVSTQLRQLLNRKSKSYNSLKVVLAGGGPIEADLIQQALDLKLPLYLTYGLTEMSSQVATRRVSSIDDADSVGQCLPDVQLRISDNNEIEVKGPSRFIGYLGLSDSVFDAEGWFATGDLGFVDSDDRLHITGRLDNQFISGGENIQPEEIETALNSIRGVEEGIVVPVSDEKYGFRPVAFVKVAGLSLSSLNIALEPLLPRFKIPIRFYPLPDSISGLKSNRVELKQKAEDLIKSESV